MDWPRTRGGTQAAGDGDRDLAWARRSTAQNRGFQPHRCRSWLTEEQDPEREEQLVDGCQASAQAAERAKQGERTLSRDDMTGVQALERKHPDFPMCSGHALRRAFASLRQRTRSWFRPVAVAAGQVSEPSWGPTRGEDEGVAHVKRVIARSPETKRWRLMRDTLDIHRSESLVRWIAAMEGSEQETLGKKGTRGMLRAMARRTAFWHDPSHRVVCSCTPKHASWMNPVEIWRRLLGRNRLKRGHFLSLDDGRDQILAFLASDHRTMAKPITWTSTGLAPDRGEREASMD